ncbi:MAG: LysR family transcriptional regulator [Deltaproteobacteria bacterium]|nr:LysR family transcriptional regulator [Deltaproteobacteria bacterium]
MLPDLESLRCFEAAATSLNFRAAAEKVHLSPAAFSARIGRLEADLGARLFERTTRRVGLTEAGRRLVPQARATLAEAARCAEVLREDSAAPPFTLTLGTRYELGMSWIVPALGALRAARPERRIDLFFGDSADLLRRLQRDQIDGLVSSVRLTDAGLAYATLHEERYRFVGCPELLARQPLEAPEHARHHTLLDIHGDLPLFRYLLDARPRSEAWEFGATEFLGTIGAVRHRALEGAGVAVLPSYFVAPDLESGRLCPLMPDHEARPDAFRLVWRRGHPQQAALRALGDELRARPLT